MKLQYRQTFVSPDCPHIFANSLLQGSRAAEVLPGRPHPLGGGRGGWIWPGAPLTILRKELDGEMALASFEQFAAVGSGNVPLRRR